MRVERFVEEMDVEWIALILEAKKLGFSKEMVRDFFNQNRVKECLIENN